MMKLRLATPVHLIDLGGVAALGGISEAECRVQIGAITTQAEMVASDLLAAHIQILRETAALIADPQVRNSGTLGGDCDWSSLSGD
jgi:carbon-monoxide dehydrogenase medium subunit